MCEDLSFVILSIVIRTLQHFDHDFGLWQLSIVMLELRARYTTIAAAEALSASSGARSRRGTGSRGHPLEA